MSVEGGKKVGLAMAEAVEGWKASSPVRVEQWFENVRVLCFVRSRIV